MKQEQAVQAQRFPEKFTSRVPDACRYYGVGLPDIRIFDDSSEQDTARRGAKGNAH